MATRKVSAGDSEFGLGRGMIDPITRQGREGMEPHQFLWEIYATNPAPPDLGAGLLGPGEVRLEIENFPETATVDRP